MEHSAFYRSIRRAGAKAAAFARKNTVFTVALVAALICVPFAPAGTDYLAFIDVKTIVCLFCILAVVGMLTNAGMFMVVAQLFRRAFPTVRRAICALVFATMGLSMFVTNDMALIIMLPLAANILLYSGWHRALAFCFIMQNLAANLGGMILPFGNPQNLFLFSYYGIGLTEFLQVMALPFGASVVLIAICCIALVGFYKGAGADFSWQGGGVKGEGASASSGPSTSSGPGGPGGLLRPRNLALGAALFVLTVLAVFRVVHYVAALFVVVAVLLVFDRKALISVDWLLLATFVCFFVFAGCVSRIPAVQQILAGAMAAQPLLTSAGVSQVISNVPAAALLSQVSGAWQPLLVGVNIGGAGTLVASLASLITLDRFRSLRIICDARKDGRVCSGGSFALQLMGYGFAFLAALLLICSFA